ncbi:hypothetical protein [Deinococcus apachensis]|uniref:hypothetical protein n=1 Tax=Deinococcus apachensis TaxID=309886 RepID=UPI000381A80B|nr:hypothetical protein [Deinococcus apachensis]
MREYIWTFQTAEGARAVAAALTRQNEEGRQALHCRPRRFYALGLCLYAAPADPLPNLGDELTLITCQMGWV